MVGVVVMALVMVSGCAKKPVSSVAATPAARPGGVVSAGPTPLAPPGAPPGSTTRPPVAVVPPSPATFRDHSALQDIYFDFDRAEIREDAVPILDRNIQWLKDRPSVKVLIEGHCDERGTTEYNLALGERRAKATRNYLTVHGIHANRITLISYGEERPLCTEHAERCWAKNRRAHFLIRE
jgi:peptidoglycan-associated lipoprotein